MDYEVVTSLPEIQPEEWNRQDAKSAEEEEKREYE